MTRAPIGVTPHVNSGEDRTTDEWIRADILTSAYHFALVHSHQPLYTQDDDSESRRVGSFGAKLGPCTVEWVSEGDRSASRFADENHADLGLDANLV